MVNKGIYKREGVRNPELLFGLISPKKGKA